ncbi:MAG: sugar ABC transporter permease [Clostridia bacterium]|nr:sugar ABC transporter permease [Clostridia bacterium]
MTMDKNNLPENEQVDVQESAPAEVVSEGEVLEVPKLSTKERVSRFLRSQQGWLFVLPALLLMCVFTFYPIVSSFVNSFKEEYDGLNDTFKDWGFDNFAVVLNLKQTDIAMGGANFLQCLTNTMVLTFVSVPLSTFVALFIAVALKSIKPLQKAYQTVLFLPYLTNSLAMGAVFLTFFQVIGTKNNVEQVGIVNELLDLFNVKPIKWIRGTTLDNKPLVWHLGSVDGGVDIPWTKYVIMIVYEVWSGLPFKILILFSALQSVNKQYYDAARIDGASRSTILWKITTPLISPMISYLLITGIMGGMKQYSAVVGVFGPQMGTNYDMGTMVGYIYSYLEEGYTGYAYAGSLILFVIIMIITLINLRVSKKRVTY